MSDKPVTIVSPLGNMPMTLDETRAAESLVAQSGMNLDTAAVLVVGRDEYLSRLHLNTELGKRQHGERLHRSLKQHWDLIYGFTAVRPSKWFVHPIDHESLIEYAKTLPESQVNPEAFTDPVRLLSLSGVVLIPDNRAIRLLP